MNLYPYGLVILSYNHPVLTCKTIQSVLALGYSPLDLILVHNGSETQHQENLVKSFPKIQHLVLEKNKGYSGGANAGLQKAFEKFRHVLFLTNDIEMIHMPKEISRNEDLLAPLIFKRNTAQVDSIMGLVNTQNGTLKHSRSFSDLQNLKSFEKMYVPGSAFILSRSCFEKLNGFDESFHTYWEDVDFSVRAQNLGFSLVHSDQIQLRHKIGKTCHKDRFYTLYLFQRNRRKFMQKHGWSGWRFKLVFGVYMLQTLLLICLKPKPKVPLQFWWKALND